MNTAYVTLGHEGLLTNVFTPSTATGAVTAPAAFYSATVLTQADNRVGIGDSTPDHLFDVAGNIGLDASSYVNFGDTDGTTGYGLRDSAGTIQFKNSAGAWTSIPATGADNLGNHTATANIQLGNYWLSPDGSSQGLHLSATGAVGIGTATAPSRLTLANNIATGPFDSFSKYQILLHNAANNPANSYGIGVRSGIMALKSGSSFDFENNSATLMRIGSSGVSIGSTTVSTGLELDVEGKV